MTDDEVRHGGSAGGTTRMTNELVAAVDVRFESWFNAKGWNAFPFQRATWEAYLHRYNQLLWTQARCMVH